MLGRPPSSHFCWQNWEPSGALPWTPLAPPSVLTAPAPSLCLLLPCTSVCVSGQRSFRGSERCPSQMSLSKKVGLQCPRLASPGEVQAAGEAAHTQTPSPPCPSSAFLLYHPSCGQEGRFSLRGDAHGHPLPLLPGHRQSHPSGEREPLCQCFLGLQIDSPWPGWVRVPILSQSLGLWLARPGSVPLAWGRGSPT